MSSRATAALERSYLRKGFRRFDTHHRRFRLWVDGQPTVIITRLSHGIAEYGDELLGDVAHQLHLTKRELLEFIDCRMSGEDYVALLRQKGELP